MKPFKTNQSGIIKLCVIINLFLFIGISAYAYQDRDENKIAVFKKNDSVWIRSWFSQEQDLIIKIHKGGNNQISYHTTGLINSDVALSDMWKAEAKIIHNCGDDSTAILLNGTVIGGNHGLFGVINLAAENHGLGEADIGSKWQDAKGNIFYLIKIANSNMLWALAENTGTPAKWQFKTEIDTSSFSKIDGGKKITIKNSSIGQMNPAARINKQEYLIDGKTPLQDNIPVICNTLDIIESYDIIAPDAVLEKIKKNPGKTCDFIAPDLESLMVRDTIYQFQPGSVCLVIQNLKLNRDLLIQSTSPVMTAPLVKQESSTYEYYIPNTLPFEVDGVKYDFNAVHTFKEPIKNSVEFRSKNSDEKNPPSRFIQMVGENGKRQIGFVMGFDITVGLGKPEALSKNSSMPVWIYKTGKTYPQIIDHKAGLLKAGTVLETVGYRKYFNPQNYVNPTCSYFYRNGNALMLYVDYHKSVANDKIKLPSGFANKKINIIEKTPSINLISGPTATDDGIVVSSEGNYGHMVMKIE